MQMFPPTNNTERYLSAIIEELRLQREILDRLLLLQLETPAPKPRTARVKRQANHSEAAL